MRVAALILSLFVSLAVLLQSCTVGLGGRVTGAEELSEAGAGGMLVAFVFMTGAAFALGLPLVSMLVFILAGLLALFVGETANFPDMIIWGYIAFVLALMSLVGSWELRRKKRRRGNEQPN